MTVATLATAMSAENRKAVVAGTIGNVLEWYDFGVYGYLATTMSQLFFPGEDKTISLLKAFAVFGVGFVMRPVGSVLFGVYGDRFGRRLALSAVIFRMNRAAADLRPSWRAGTHPGRSAPLAASRQSLQESEDHEHLHRG